MSKSIKLTKDTYWDSLAMAQETLYTGSSKITDIALNDDVSNYKYLKIFYTNDSDIYSSVEVHNPNGKYVGMTAFHISDTKCFQKYCVYYISGTSMTFQYFYEQYNTSSMTVNDDAITGSMNYYNRNSSSTATSPNAMIIREVIGYR